MKKGCFNIIKPFLVYWAACITYLIFGNWSVSGANISACLIYLIGGISCGYFMNFKKGITGLALLGAQLTVCMLIPWKNDFLRNVSQLGNIFTTLLDYWIPDEELKWLVYILAVAVPLLVILVGTGFKKIVSNRN
ncbi:MAG: hypothetical protein ACI4IR_06620 [Eubacterium sp.]